MALLERVSTLLRANINDLLRKAEDPEKLARQLWLDMENQLVQVKTQVAMAIADQHLLQKKMQEQELSRSQWMRKAELAVAKEQDDLARAALERALTHERMAARLREQYADQAEEAEVLRQAYSRLQHKLVETQGQVDLIVTQLRRSRAAGKLQTAHALLSDTSRESRLGRLADEVREAATRNSAARTLVAVATAENVEERMAALERNEAVEALLLEIKGHPLKLSGRAETEDSES